ncbi:MAG: hypothetical protein KDD40_08280 [Bdellovibrionales bacterium]|nr:hypothetical protein [Bdellovibrionales bacterium]
MKTGIGLIIFFLHFYAQAERINCQQMKSGFRQALGGEHVYSSEQKYLKRLANDTNIWLKALQFMREVYDPYKLFYLTTDNLPQEEADHAQKLLNSFSPRNHSCQFLDELFLKLRNYITRFNEVLESELTRAEYFQEILNLAPLTPQEYSADDIKLYSSQPQNLEQLKRKIKMYLAQRFNHFKQFEKTDKAAFAVAVKELKFVAKDYLLKEPQLVYSVALQSVLRSFDVHSSFMWQEKAEDFLVGLNETYAGIGVEIELTLLGLRVLKVIANGPADLQGKLLQKDDIITWVDGREVRARLAACF